MNTLNEILNSLPTIKDNHNRSSHLYKVFEKAARFEIETMFREAKQITIEDLPCGNIVFPYFKMGAVDSLDLFGLDELILFSFYWANRNRYKKVLDIGANIGLHTLILAKLGYEVQSFEPDPIHFKKLEEILEMNKISDVELYQAAVSSQSGKEEFIRVLGNTTSSHISGSKTPYGKIEKFEVPTYAIQSLISEVDLIKMDVEGHEADIITATNETDWNTTDAVLEVGSTDKAQTIFGHLQKIGLNAFAQKLDWKKVESSTQMPQSYKEGSLFISKKSKMPW
ncbi:MAG: FkbM family methyltransferase [Chlamydiota bacterium]|jgi:FkbM family methyltransferase